MKKIISKANVLVEEALPYVQRFQDKIFVIKYGGNAMISDELKHSVMKDVALLKTFGIRPVLVHGGGPEISREMAAARLEPKFVNGLRVTDAATITIVRRVFERTNREIRDLLRQYRVRGCEVRGALFARAKDPALGLVGELTGVDAARILKIVYDGRIPVISPLARGGAKTYNINADTAATEVAIALRAEKLTILTDVDGVMEKRRLVRHLSFKDAQTHIKRGVITEGMIPKVEACIRAVRGGCRKAHLVNGTVSHALLFEIFTDSGIGTEIVRANRDLGKGRRHSQKS